MTTNQPALWFPTAIERRHSRDLDALDRHTELAEERIAGIARVGSRAIVEQLKVGLLAREATRLDPDGAEHYALLRAAGTYGMANVIDRHARGR